MRTFRQFSTLLMLMLSHLAGAQIVGSVNVDVTLAVPAPMLSYGSQNMPLKAAKVPVIQGKSGKLLDINVLDYNPVFYTYTVSAVQTPTASANALAEIIPKLQAFGKAATGTQAAVNAAGQGLAGTRCSTRLNNVDITRLHAQLTSAAVALSDTLPTHNTLPDQLKLLAAATSVATLRSTAQTAYLTLKSSSEDAKDAANKLNDLSTLLFQSVSATGQFRVTWCDPGSASERHYPDLPAQPAQTLAQILSGLGAISTTVPNGDQGATLALDELEEVLGFGGGSYKDYIDTFNLFASLVVQLQVVGVAKILNTPDKEWPDFASGLDNTVTINVAENKSLQPLLTSVSSDISSHAGDYKIDLKTKELIDFSVSAAAIYSFVKNPSYSAQTANAKLTIMETNTDYNKLSGAVALNMTPDKWDSYYVRPHLQVGLVPDSSKTAVFLGLGFSAGSPGSKSSSTSGSSKQSSSSSQLDFNIGAIYQKTTELGAGLAVGQTVATTQDLKTDTAYKVGLYLGIGYSLK
ncbi:MAG: hypothetical protein ABSF94_17530 [Steroidobacteraceae bacterium]|jgi:hypothetical protein